MKRGLVSKRSVTSDDPRLMEYMTYIGDNLNRSVSVASGDTAMKIAAVYRSISILSGTIASLPRYPRRKTAKGNFEIDYSNPLYNLLMWRTSNKLNAYETFESAVIQTLMEGNAYLFPKMKGSGYSELVLLEKGTVVYDEFVDRYYIADTKNGVIGTYDSWQVVHFRNKNLDGSKKGISTIQYAGRILNISANADEQTLANMKSGNKQKGFLTGGSLQTGMGAFKDTEVDKVAERLEAQLAKGDSVMRLPGELQWLPYSISPADAQILENREFSVFDVCRFFGVHPDKVFVRQNSNYKASENSQTSFMTDTLQPLLTQMEVELTTKLVPRKNVGVKEKIEFDREALYQLDPSGSASYYKQMFEVGGMTSDEIRVATNREPKEGGDVLFVSANVAPINSAKIYGEPREEKKVEKVEEKPKLKE